MELLDTKEVNMMFFGGKKSYYSINSMARKKQLPSLKIGKSLFFERETLEQFFKEKMMNQTEDVVDSIHTVRVVDGIKRIE